MISQIFFFFFAAVAIASGIGLIVSRNPVSGALWLVLNLCCVAALYVTMNARFIGVAQIIVYAGAIMVLFLFVIMLLNLAPPPKVQNIDWKRAVAFLLGMVVFAQLTYALASSLDFLPEPTMPDAASGSASALGQELLTRYALPLEITGILLLAATIGAVLLARRKFE